MKVFAALPLGVMRESQSDVHVRKRKKAREAQEKVERVMRRIHFSSE